jgi:hypothetical protein
MRTRLTLPGTRGVVVTTLLCLVLVGCSPVAASPAPAASASSAVATDSAPAPTVTDPSPTVAGLDGPPEATLAAEGGDPVVGQLGTYVWFDSGSDAPWLQGSPITVGAGEPVAVTLVPAGNIETWTARFVPAGATDPTGAVVLGEGSGDPSFPAPRPGAWTVEVAVIFAAGAGKASYFWRLQVE